MRLDQVVNQIRILEIKSVYTYSHKKRNLFFKIFMIYKKDS